MSDNSTALLYVTVPDVQTAEQLSEALVTKKLAACVNILPSMQSIYEWEGKVERASEIVLIVKTDACHSQAARDHIITHHPYDVPCVLALPISPTASHQAFMAWIEQSLTKGKN